MQTLDSLPQGHNNKITCCYVNATSAIQVARISNVENWYFERVVFPGQRLLFEAVPEAKLEIHTGALASSILADIIPCLDLVVRDPALPWSGSEVVRERQPLAI
ncbi:MAG: DUF1830 domain-containing protein [Thermostichales cyanobacterium BF3_bins_165]